MSADLRDVDPRDLQLPSSRSTGADAYKLQRQIAKFGTSIDGMPPIWVFECSDGTLQITDGVTRATRVAKLLPGTLVQVEIVGKFSRTYSSNPKIGDLLP